MAQFTVAKGVIFPALEIVIGMSLGFLFTKLGIILPVLTLVIGMVLGFLLAKLWELK